MVQKKILSLFLTGLLFATSTPTYASVHVDGYTKSDGTYVQPHYRSNPDGNFNNNWSTKGNVNPYTGQEGTKTHPEYSSGSGYSVQSPVQVPPTTSEPTPTLKTPDFSQLGAEQQKRANDLEETLKKQSEENNKRIDEINKQYEESKQQTDKRTDEINKQYEESKQRTDEQIEDSLKKLDEIGNYTPPKLNSSTYTNTQNTTSDQTESPADTEQTDTQDNKQNDSKVDSGVVHAKSVQSNQSWWQKFINSIKGLFSATKVNGNGNDQSVYYENCTDARAQGADPVYQGDPGYTSDLDRDGDGVGCE